MTQSYPVQKIHYTLRLASAMCFIGHGVFGIITKKIWLNYFALFGIGNVTGYHLMPWLGTVDIFVGISLLFYPIRASLLWLVIWGMVTASLRPLSGEPFAEAIERAGNYGTPLVLLILYGFGGKTFKDWFISINPKKPIDDKLLSKAVIGLRIVVFLLFIGHGWLNLIEKKGLLDQYRSIGLSNPSQIAHIAGIFEIFAAAIVLIRPIRPVLIAFLFWKMGTELFYPHWEVFEWIERGGSYGSILALWLMLPKGSKTRNTQLGTTMSTTLLASCLFGFVLKLNRFSATAIMIHLLK